jgi:uncharacterized protein (UPF0335 family)
MFDGMERVEHIAKRIVDKVIDTYVDNLAEREDGAIVVESQWMKDMRQAIIGEITGCECEGLENEWPQAAAQIARLQERVIRLEKENAVMLDILKPFFPHIVPPGCDVWEMVKAAVSALRNPLADEGPVRTDVWVGGRSDGEVRL